MKAWTFLLSLLFALSAGSRSPALGETPPRAPRLFLSCRGECFDAYLRQELSYFDLVRDPHLADITIVIVRQPAGNGGERFTIELALRERPPEQRAARSFVAPPGASAHASRAQLRDLVLRALHFSLLTTSHEAAFHIGLPARSDAELSTLPDRWHYWVVAPELRGTGEGGTGYYFAELTSALTVRRITAPSKLRIRGTYGRALSGYRLEDGSRIRGDLYRTEGRTLYAYSVGERFAVGAVASGRAAEYENLRGHVHGGPLVELNAFPYAENASRQLRTAYQVGAWANWYIERNVAGLTREVRPYHALSLIADVNQPWGSIQWVGQLNSFIEEPRRYRVGSGAVLSLRLVEGLAVTLEGTAAFVRDQISLRQRPVSDRELLLWTAQQPTNYTFEAEVALSYTFGSVHNTVVNPRFARVDLDEE